MAILLHVLYTVKEGKRTEFFELLNQLEIPQKSREEDDNIRYDYFFPVDSENHLFLLEIWKSKEGLELHKKMPHFIKLQEIKEDYIEGAKLDVYEI